MKSLISVKALDPRKRAQTLAYYVAFITLGIVNASAGPVLQDLAVNLEGSLSGVGTAFAMGSAGYMLGSYVSGYLYDKIPGHRLMAVYFAMISVLMSIVTFVPGLVWLGVLMFFLGMAQGGVDVGGNTLLLWLHGDDAGSYMNFLHFTFGIGAALSPLVIGQLLRFAEGLRWSFWFVAASALPALLIMWIIPSPGIRQSIQVNAVEHGKSPVNQSKRVIVGLISAFFFMYVGAESGFSRWIATYARSMGIGDATVAANLTSVYWGALTVGRFLSIPIAAKLRPRSILILDLVGTASSVACIVLFPQAYWLTWAATAGAGLFMASIFPTMMSLAERHLRVSGKITGTFFVGGSLGSLVLPWVIGLLFEQMGPAITVQMILLGVVLDCLVFAVLLALLDGHRRSLKNERQ